MFGYFWIPLGLISILIQCASGVTEDKCESNVFEFWGQGLPKMPAFCAEFTWRFNNPEYRINFTESEVETLCSSDICKTYFSLIILPCTLHTKKDLNCLDSPGLINVWCGNSDRHNNTNCFTSLSNQGVISTPSLLTPCLDAIYNATSCPAYCRDLLENADCCFASYYAFMIDAYLNDTGLYPVFENRTRFLETLWGWCDLPTPTICPDLNLIDNSARPHNVTCDAVPPVIEMPTIDTDNGGTNCNGTDCDVTDNGHNDTTT